MTRRFAIGLAAQVAFVAAVWTLIALGLLGPAMLVLGVQVGAVAVSALRGPRPAARAPKGATRPTDAPPMPREMAAGMLAVASNVALAAVGDLCPDERAALRARSTEIMRQAAGGHSCDLRVDECPHALRVVADLLDAAASALRAQYPEPAETAP